MSEEKTPTFEASCIYGTPSESHESRLRDPLYSTQHSENSCGNVSRDVSGEALSTVHEASPESATLTMYFPKKFRTCSNPVPYMTLGA